MSSYNWKSVYVLLASDGKVKIGISKDAASRTNAIEWSKEVRIMDVYSTALCSNPYSVERICHDSLKEYQVFGKWFEVDFDTAVEKVKDIFNEYARFDEKNNDISDVMQAFYDSVDDVMAETVATQAEIMEQQSHSLSILTDNVNMLAGSVLDVVCMVKDIVCMLDALKAMLEERSVL